MGPRFEVDATNDPRRVNSNARNGSFNGSFALVILPRSVTGSGRLTTATLFWLLSRVRDQLFRTALKLTALQKQGHNHTTEIATTDAINCYANLTSV
jgi:hypothetical protein